MCERARLVKADRLVRQRRPAGAMAASSSSLRLHSFGIADKKRNPSAVRRLLLSSDSDRLVSLVRALSSSALLLENSCRPEVAAM